MRHLLFFVLSCTLFCTCSWCQNQYPLNYFDSPLKIPLLMAGTFGELRPNHFHSGIDFKTQQKEGLPVFASAAGRVSRIKISTQGYGKSIYIEHANGYTSVYAHLQTFVPKIQKIINTEHYAQKEYEIELFPAAEQIILEKGEQIGYSGNTGGSSGPHLHFEIRDTKTEKIINPLLFGFDKHIKDDIKPMLEGIIAYSINDSSTINGTNAPLLLSITQQKDGSYLTNKIVATGKIAFAINAYDKSNDNYGKNGIYKLETYLNGTPYFGYELDSFSFDQTKYINTFIDYPRYQSTKQRFQKMFVGYFYATDIIKIAKNNGFINLDPNFTFNYKIVLQDFCGNKAVVNIPIVYGKLPLLQPEKIVQTPYFLKARIDNAYQKDAISVYIPENTFYDDFYLNFDVKDNQLYLHDSSVAVVNPFSISFDVTNIPIADREKMFIANREKNHVSYNTTYKKENTFTIKTKKLGNFFLEKDTIAPTIYNPSFKEGANLDNTKTIKVYISDDKSGIKDYKAYLNGNWILMEYETKLNRLTHNLLDNLYQKGKNEFKIIVTDNLGNSTTFESFFYKNN